MSTAAPIVITNPQLVPPGGWRYTQEESGFTMDSITLAGLREKIESHRRANGYDLGDGWWEMVQLELCLDLGIVDSHCGAKQEEKTEEPRLKIVDLLQFFRTMREWKNKTNFEMVDKDEATRRAEICVDCPDNVDVKGCWGCQGVVRWLEEYLTDEDHVPQRDKLKSCRNCKCVLAMKVHLPIEVAQTADPRGTKYPEHCWMHEG